MRFALKIQQYPNQELRATLYRQRSVKESVDAESVKEVPAVAPLDITSKLSPEVLGSKPGFGGVPSPTRFGLNAKRQIQRASGVFEHDAIPKGELVFLTGTVPGSRRGIYDALAKWSSWSVKAVKTWLSNAGVVDNYSMYVWEFQKRGALHIHYLVWVPDGNLRKKIMEEWREKWAQILDSVGEKEGIDMWQQSNGRSWKHHRAILQAPAQVVIKSVGSYLSKYLSKNAPNPGKRIDVDSEPLCPVRWWGVSRPLLKRLGELSNEFIIEGIEFHQVRRIWARIGEEFQSLASAHYEYCDRIGWSKVLVCFDEDSGLLFNEFWRDWKNGYSSCWSSF
jgi:hypothetical protein